jgi:hypothetical protein
MSPDSLRHDSADAGPLTMAFVALPPWTAAPGGEIV